MQTAILYLLKNKKRQKVRKMAHPALLRRKLDKKRLMPLTSVQVCAHKTAFPVGLKTASGTLLDSYRPPELELDEKAIEKAPDVPGWDNTASGTLTDSYVTTKEAKQQLEQEKAEIEQKIADEKQELDQKVERGELTEAQAKQIHRAKLEPEERERLEKIDVAEAKIAEAEKSFEAYSGMMEVQAGQDSQVMLDGVAQLSSHNNVIEDAIEGVNLTLKGKSEVRR